MSTAVVCEWCGQRFVSSRRDGRGRPAKYCSDRCRQRAHRQRVEQKLQAEREGVQARVRELEKANSALEEERAVLEGKLARLERVACERESVPARAGVAVEVLDECVRLAQAEKGSVAIPGAYGPVIARAQDLVLEVLRYEVRGLSWSKRRKLLHGWVDQV